MTHLEAIATHAAGLADSARGHLEAPVEHCPGWDVADLVAHVTGVHWFWATVVEERLTEPPAPERRPPRAEDLLGAFHEGADRLVRVLDQADPRTHVWTWAPDRQDVAFVLRHQVQEAAVHHWDAVHAAGGTLELERDLASDAVDEFLGVSVSREEDPADPPRPSLDGSFALLAGDTGAGWTLVDGATPGTVRAVPGVDEGVPVLVATAADLLLWLYRRVEIDTSAVPDELLQRFRALCFTD